MYKRQIHSWAGIGLGRGDTDKLLGKVRANSKASKNWRVARVLLIDEISMLGSDLFGKLAAIGAAIRGVPKAFGGLQVVVCGDFFQVTASSPLGARPDGASRWSVRRQLTRLPPFLSHRGREAAPGRAR